MGPVAKNVAFLMCHEKVGTRYRGHRLMAGRFESDLCPRCQDQRETQTHRYGRGPMVVRAWEQARAVMEDMAPELEQVSNKNMLHLFYPRVERETDVLWVLGNYIEYVEHEAILQGNKCSAGGLLGYLRYRRSASKWIAMPELGMIPGVD